MKRLLCLISAASLLMALVGCASNNEQKSGVGIYYINSSGNGLVSESTDIKADYSQDAVDNIIDEISKTVSVDGEELKSVLQNGLIIASYDYDKTERRINIDLSGDYGSLTNTGKLMLMAGLTLTFEQINGIDGVHITIQGEPLLDSNGNDIQSLQTNDFVIHSGNEINIYTSTKMQLYFPDTSGKRLTSETRTVYYNSNVPLEQVVLDEIIKGPQDTTSHRAAVPNMLSCMSVTIQDEVCYVNFDENAVQVMTTYNCELALESIVKSIAAVCGVDKVQFLVNGETSVEFADGTSLDHIYEA